MLVTLLLLHFYPLGDCCTGAFILPSVYRKHARQCIIPKEWRIVSTTNVGRDCFTLDGRDYRVPISFLLWKGQRARPKGSTPR